MSLRATLLLQLLLGDRNPVIDAPAGRADAVSRPCRIEKSIAFEARPLLACHVRGTPMWLRHEGDCSTHFEGPYIEW